MDTLKVVGKSGQISLGKSLAGMGFVVKPLPGGDILLEHSVVIPASEHWLHEPKIKDKLARADKWMRNNAPQKSSLSEIEKKLDDVA